LRADALAAGEMLTVSQGTSLLSGSVELKEAGQVGTIAHSRKLTPGSAPTVEAHQGKRKVMVHLLSSVQQVSAEAGRER
jgi:hypothetical protein